MQKALYKSAIKHPMAFLTMKAAVRAAEPTRKIQTYAQLALAIDLMVANCARFNGEASDLTGVARACRAEYDRAVLVQQEKFQSRLQASLLQEAQEANLGARRPRAPVAGGALEPSARRCAFALLLSVSNWCVCGGRTHRVRPRGAGPAGDVRELPAGELVARGAGGASRARRPHTAAVGAMLE